MMNTYIGIDLGTSSVKMLLVDKLGKILNSVTEEYPIYYPQKNYSEQNPNDWFIAVKKGIKALLSGFDGKLVKGVSFGGQMHGLVILDEHDEVIRNAILWNDGRTVKETEYLNNVIGKNVLYNETNNIAFAGFTAPKILWVKNNEPENFKRIKKIMLPKDYIAYKLTGVFSTDYSDAAGTLLLDVKNKCWNKKMLKICDITEDYLPKLYNSHDVIGVIKPEIANEFNLQNNVVVTAGAGDNAAAAVGVGVINEGECNLSLGTSGTVFLPLNKIDNNYVTDLHCFNDVNGNYHLLGCILSAASCNKWWMNVLNTNDYLNEQADLENLIGKNNVLFAPYLAGERCPHNDVNVKGSFIGLTADTTRKQMNLAVLEGVAFALRDCIENGKVTITSTKICGGGAKSKLWLKIIANVLNAKVIKTTVDEGPSYGACILAMVGAKEYDSVSTAINSFINVKEVITPDDETVELYNDKYNKFKLIYPSLKNLYENY